MFLDRRRLRLVNLALPALLLAAPLPALHRAASGSASIPSGAPIALPAVVGDLQAFVETELLPSIPGVPGTGSEVSPTGQRNQYVLPTTSQLATFRGVVRRMLSGDFVGAHLLAKTVSATYNVVEFTDTVHGGVHYVLMEGVPGSIPAPVDHAQGVHLTHRSDPTRRGWGTYVFRPTPVKPVGFSAPHPKDDLDTAELAVEAYLLTGGRYLSIAGTDRDQNVRLGACTQSPTRAFGQSDMAHNAETVFQIAFEELYAAEDELHHVQIHGSSSCSDDVFLSNGVATPPNALNVLAQRIQAVSSSWAQGGPTLSVDVYDHPGDCSLRGWKNIQLRFAAGRTHDSLCASGLPANPSRFFHVECHLSARLEPGDPLATPGVNRAVVLTAIQQTF